MLFCTAQADPQAGWITGHANVLRTDRQQRRTTASDLEENLKGTAISGLLIF